MKKGLKIEVENKIVEMVKHVEDAEKLMDYIDKITDEEISFCKLIAGRGIHIYTGLHKVAKIFKTDVVETFDETPKEKYPYEYSIKIPQALFEISEIELKGESDDKKL